jgi:hypothetical protein
VFKPAVDDSTTHSQRVRKERVKMMEERGRGRGEGMPSAVETMGEEEEEGERKARLFLFTAEARLGSTLLILSLIPSTIGREEEGIEEGVVGDLSKKAPVICITA